jgi:hypothetical protein
MSQGTQKPLVIRAWPKMIFLWPAAVTSLLMCIANQWGEWENVWGGVYLIVFGINMMVLTFEFPRATSLTVAMVVVAGILGLLLLNQRFAVIAPLQQWLAGRQVHASTEFYLFLFLLHIVLFIGMYIVTRFDYWELTSNELIHHHGLLGDVERFSTAGLKLNKEISDIFEYAIAGAGRVVIQIPGNPRPVILDNVLNIGTIERVADRILDARVVRVEREPAMAESTPEDRARGDEAEGT